MLTICVELHICTIEIALQNNLSEGLLFVQGPKGYFKIKGIYKYMN